MLSRVILVWPMGREQRQPTRYCLCKESLSLLNACSFFTVLTGPDCSVQPAAGKSSSLFSEGAYMNLSLNKETGVHFSAHLTVRISVYRSSILGRSSGHPGCNELNVLSQIHMLKTDSSVQPAAFLNAQQSSISCSSTFCHVRVWCRMPVPSLPNLQR